MAKAGKLPWGTRFMDFCARIWLAIGGWFRSRPATVIGLSVGAVIFASALTYVIVEQTNTEKQLQPVTAAFCNGSDPSRSDPANQKRCQDLLRTLLTDPDEDNAKRLREIVRDQ